MSRPYNKNRPSGFTLIELLVVVVIAAIGMALAAPAFTDAIRKNRIAGETNTLLAALSFARSEAIRRNTPVSFCASNTGGTACEGNWNSKAWLVWADADNDSVVDSGEPVLRVGTSDPTNTLASPNSTAVVSIRFTGRGLRAFPASLGNDEPARISVRPTTCPSGKRYVRVLSVNFTGMVTVPDSATSSTALCP